MGAAPAPMGPAPENAEMAAAWDGDEGAHWAERADDYDRTIRRHSEHLLAAAAVEPGHEVLDVGCGCGRTTIDLARFAADGRALGVDLSGPMLEVARKRAADEGVANVAFEQGDAQVLPFPPGGFDLVVSRYGAMFFGDPPVAFANLARALRPGGRIALLAWQELSRNEWLSELWAALAVGRELPDPPRGQAGPFGLAERDTVRSLLAGAGFEDVAVDPLEAAMELGPDADRAYAWVSGLGIVRGLTEDLDDATRAVALDGLRRLLVEHETPEGVLIGSASWVVTGRRA